MQKCKHSSVLVFDTCPLKLHYIFSVFCKICLINLQNEILL